MAGTGLQPFLIPPLGRPLTFSEIFWLHVDPLAARDLGDRIEVEEYERVPGVEQQRP